MLKKNQGVRKLVMGRLLSFLLVLAVVISPFSTSFAGTAYAATGQDPTPIGLVGKPVISNNNYDVTLTFDGPVQGIDEGWADKIDVRASYEGIFYNADDEYEAYSEIVGNTVIIHLDYDLGGDKNQIRIREGAFQGQNGVILSPEFAALDVENPSLDGMAISEDLKTVTFTFDKNVTTVTNDVYNYVKVNGGFLTNQDPISVTGNQLIITVAEALTANPRIDILSGALKSDNGVENNRICARLNLNPIQISGIYVGNDSIPNTNLYFDFANNQYVLSNLSDADLKAAITISKDGGTPVALAANDTAGTGEGFYVHFFKSLAPGNYVVHIAAGALKNSIGLVNGALTSGTIEISDRTAPVYQGVEVNAERNKVTLTFDEAIVDNQTWTDCPPVWMPGPMGPIPMPCITPVTHSNLNNYITINRSDSSGFSGLSEGDSAAVSGKTLVVTLSTPLAGSQNKIFVSSGALKDVNNNVLYTGVTTRFIDVSTIAPPQYVNATIDNLNHDYTIYFDKKIKNNLGSLEALHDAILVSTDGSMPVVLDSVTQVTYTDNKVVLRFVNPLADRNIQIYIPANTIADEYNNVLEEVVVTDPVTPNDFYQPQMYYAYLTSQHSVQIRFITAEGQGILVDNTINETGSHLKDFVTYSTDRGVNFLPLQTEDVVSVDNNNNVVVYFAHVVEGNLQIKIAANKLKDTAGVVLKTDVITGDIYTNLFPYYLSGALFSNAPTALTFEDNSVWRSKIQKVVLKENEYWGGSSERILSPSEYTISAGKLTIHQGVFENNSRYYRIHVYSDGFNTSTSDFMRAIKSQDSYFIAPVKLYATNGITVKARIVENEYGGHLNVIFQLLNGNEPVSIIAAESDYFESGTFTANFNVQDVATNPNYRVRVFVVNEFNSSELSVGVNLATLVTDAEYDVLVNGGMFND